MKDLGRLAIEYVPIESVQQHPDNANNGNVEVIRQSIKANGVYQAIVVQRSTGYILRGNHTWQAFIGQRLTEIPVTFVDVDDAEALRIMVVDNHSNRLGQDDEGLLVPLLEQIADSNEGLYGTGYDPDDLTELIRRMEGPIEVLDLTEKVEDPGHERDETWLLTPIEGHDGHAYEIVIAKTSEKPFSAGDFNRIRKKLGLERLEPEEIENFGIEAWQKR